MVLPALAPMLASPAGVTGLSTGWATEVKWDGWRAMVSVDATVRVRTRRGRDVTASLPELAPLAEALAGRSLILDGELVTCTAGVDFYRLAGRMAASRRTAIRAATAAPVTFVIFDLLHLDGVDLMASRCLKRKDTPSTGWAWSAPAWVVNRWYPEDSGNRFAACVEQGHEGVVVKRLDSPYRPGVRTRTWLIMCRRLGSCHRRRAGMTIRA